ncbi:MAG: sigma 54-interacting transcriptional regulator [Lewinellaceae bacterium]|nr:sigma 54-interacting transcriptional regulator [Lewinellaceae bacterium]
MIQSSEYQLKEEAILRKVVEGTALFTGNRFFRALVKNLAESLNVHGAWVTEYDEANRRLRAQAFWLGSDWVDQYEYDIRGTPCEPAIDSQALVHIPDKAIELFPEDPDLAPMNAVSYMGIPLKDADRKILGHLAVLDTKPMPPRKRLQAVFRIFAARATAEMQRQKAIRQLRESETQLRRLFEGAMDKIRLLEGEKKIPAITIERDQAGSAPCEHRHFDEIIGESPKITEALARVRQVARTNASVLITGETGTGKELFARAIHRASLRQGKPMIRLNCAALPANLIESELFGHEKGAFTGATAKREGRFMLADGGTIFLDEIGELPLTLQPKLLRVLQEGEFEPVGSSKTAKVNVRVIAATNRNLLEEAKKGNFREDLYYRLNVFPLNIPPLRERGHDVALIASALAHKSARKMGKRIMGIPEDEIRKLLAYSWPGNVRELQNVIERAVITAPEGGDLRFSQDLPEWNAHPDPGKPPPLSENSRIYTQQELGRLERENIIRALNAAGWKISGKNGAAELLQIAPSTLNSRIKALGITRH